MWFLHHLTHNWTKNAAKSPSFASLQRLIFWVSQTIPSSMISLNFIHFILFKSIQELDVIPWIHYFHYSLNSFFIRLSIHFHSIPQLTKTKRHQPTKILQRHPELGFHLQRHALGLIFVAMRSSPRETTTTKRSASGKVYPNWAPVVWTTIVANWCWVDMINCIGVFFFPTKPEKKYQRWMWRIFLHIGWVSQCLPFKKSWSLPRKIMGI